jgi:hypothetical protein
MANLTVLILDQNFKPFKNGHNCSIVKLFLQSFFKRICIGGVDKVSTDTMVPGEVANVQKVKFIVGSSRQDCILLIEGSILYSCYKIRCDFTNNYRDASQPVIYTTCTKFG